MLNRMLLSGLALLLAATPSVLLAQLRPAQHSREGKLPSMITTRSEVEKLLTELIAVAGELPPAETFVRGDMTVMIGGRTRDGRGVSATVNAAQGLDTLRYYLGPQSDLARVFVSVHDGRGYHAIAGVVHHPRVASLSISLDAASTGHGNMYRVSGYDRTRVNQIADRIEGFGKSFATWRAPAIGEMIKSGVKVLALLLLPLALVLRDRRGTWLLYPTSAALFVATYAFPFAAMFTNLTIVGAR